MSEQNFFSVELPVIRTEQPIGTFYVGKMSSIDLIAISRFDIRSLPSENEFDNYVGIQRRTNETRVREIARYVTLPDATFPTAVVLAIEGKYVEIESGSAEHESFCLLRIRTRSSDGEFFDLGGVARVLDGQHRIKGLIEAQGEINRFEVNVCVFVDADIADQASIFATVNLAQTKVNPSLVYDLLAYSGLRTPEKIAHVITVAIDSNSQSPFYRRIKRLGVSTEGRFGEMLTQATVVKALLPYLTDDIIQDRKAAREGESALKSIRFDSKRLIFRQWYIEGKDEMIASQIMHYFEAVRRRWPIAWESVDKGNILPRTNGFRAFMRFLKDAIIYIGISNDIVRMPKFLDLFKSIDIKDEEFNANIYVPGTSGETRLYRELIEKSKLDRYMAGGLLL